jgi:hypothetical protein
VDQIATNAQHVAMDETFPRCLQSMQSMQNMQNMQVQMNKNIMFII